jgi:hypothetical protein
MDAAGNATLLSPHENEHNYWVFDSANAETGKTLVIDMELMIKDINDSFELDYIHETQDGEIVPRSTEGSLLGKLFSKVSAWLADATNGIAKIFTQEIETQTLCVSDESGDKTCITKSQLDALLINAGTSGTSSSGGSGGGGGSSSPAPEPESAPATPLEPTGSTNPASNGASTTTPSIPLETGSDSSGSVVSNGTPEPVAEEPAAEDPAPAEPPVEQASEPAPEPQPKADQPSAEAPEPAPEPVAEPAV